MPKILIKRGTATQWAASTTALLPGELGLDTTNNILKVGNGTSLWGSLTAINFTNELAQDAIDLALNHSDHSNIVVTYNDAQNKIVLSSGPDLVTQSDLGNSLGDYIPLSYYGNIDGVATLDSSGLIPDTQIPSTIARDSELFSGSYDDLTDKPILFGGSYNELSDTPDLTVYAPKASPTFTGTVTTDDLIVDGDLTVNGTNFAASATSITIEDNLVQLAHNNAANTVDLGLVVGYTDGTAKHAGIVKDVSAGKWKFFKDVTTEPSTVVDFTQGSLDDLEVADLTASSATINNPIVTGKLTVNGTNTSYLSSAYSGFTGEITLDNTGVYISSADDAGGDAASVSAEAGILTLSGATGSSPVTEMYLDNSGVQIVRVNGSNSETRLEVFGAQGTTSPLKVTGNTTTFTGSVNFGSSSLSGSGYTYASITIPVYNTIAELPSAASNHGRWAHVHGEGAMFFAHGGAWYRALSESNLYVSTNAQGGSYTLATSDLDKTIEMSGGGTLTISDSSSFPVGFSCNILQTGSSQVSVAGSGFTVNGTPGLKLRAQWSSATLVKRALNSWVLMGDLSA
jgi:hypothetical protein